MFIGIVVYFLSLIFILMVNRKKRLNLKISSTWEVNSNFELAIATWYFIFWFPDCILMITETFFEPDGPDYWILVTYTLGHTFSLVLLGFLYYTDDQFNSSFRKIFKIY
ncbi:hypothetical protein HHI36_008183 [Cryptolaemus montrouzieri]|uniref:Uncharacterized protein n=1 Tax=Cryptolaemus montrouzieri TaxID=559131 RepID=A0ABD2MRM2_9CUCU